MNPRNNVRRKRKANKRMAYWKVHRYDKMLAKVAQAFSGAAGALQKFGNEAARATVYVQMFNDAFHPVEEAQFAVIEPKALPPREG